MTRRELKERVAELEEALEEAGDIIDQALGLVDEDDPEGYSEGLDIEE